MWPRKAVEMFVTKKIGPAFDELGEEVVRLEKDPNLNLPQELREKLETIRRWHSHGQTLASAGDRIFEDHAATDKAQVAAGSSHPTGC